MLDAVIPKRDVAFAVSDREEAELVLFAPPLVARSAPIGGPIGAYPLQTS
ncbi:MAG: hypothetical protein JO110_09615 [Acetobacteraceae bacterium]|nr:hypothetical protein [Acetobacteraceae bacterium]